MRELHDPGHKFQSHMASYLYGLDAGSADEEMSDEHDSSGIARFGKRLLMWDSQGFVGVERCDSVEQAHEMFEALLPMYDIEDEEVGASHD